MAIQKARRMSRFVRDQRDGEAMANEGRCGARGRVCEMSGEVVVPIEVTQVELCCLPA
jgi:hypothetical protein